MPGAIFRWWFSARDACQQLEFQPVTILGAQYFLQEFDSLESKYFLDIIVVGGVRSLHSLGCVAVYTTFRETLPCKGVVMWTWGVYFSTSTRPPQLVRISRLCEQIAHGKLMYPVREKKCSYPFGTTTFWSTLSFIALAWEQHWTQERGNNKQK